MIVMMKIQIVIITYLFICLFNNITNNKKIK